MKTTRIIAVAILAITVASCCSCRTKTRGLSLTSNNWQLTQIEGETVTPRGGTYTLQFGVDNRISGLGDCNRLMGGYTSDDKCNLTFEGTASTRMLCPDQEAESRFLRVLETANGYRIDGNTLMLLHNGQTVMVLRKTV